MDRASTHYHGNLGYEAYPQSRLSCFILWTTRNRQDSCCNITWKKEQHGCLSGRFVDDSTKYIGETEKNLAGLFDLAENRNWILFFDEADALFGKRSSSNSSNDRHANQEVAYLLQRIEDFPGTIILATNLKSNIDEAFLRRFQTVIYFPVPTEELRFALWQSMLPKEWLGKDAEETIATAAQIELSGGMIVNIVRQAAILLADRKIEHINSKNLASLIAKIQG